MVDFHWNGKRPMLSLFKTKGDKQTIKNYRPVSLLPICGKIFERWLYETMFDFFSKNNLLSRNQSGCRPERFLHQSTSFNES